MLGDDDDDGLLGDDDDDDDGGADDGDDDGLLGNMVAFDLLAGVTGSGLLGWISLSSPAA